MSQWFYSLGGQRYGPVTAGQLKRLATEGTVRPTDLVLKEGSTTWVAAARVKGLFPAKREPVLDAESPVSWPAGPAARNPELTHQEQLAKLQEALIDGRIDKAMYDRLKTDLLAVPLPDSSPEPAEPEPEPLSSFQVTGFLVLEAAGGQVGTEGVLELYLDGELVGTGTKIEGFHLPFETTPGRHTLKIKGITKGFFGGENSRVFPLRFAEPGVYTVSFEYGWWSNLLGEQKAAEIPTKCEVKQKRKPRRRS